ncbi:hypothetical protein [uncultured Mediterranean phage uvMED]|nr:hypothetical protein [uncultured Mediterranean phage uvMED]
MRSSKSVSTRNTKKTKVQKEKERAERKGRSVKSCKKVLNSPGSDTIFERMYNHLLESSIRAGGKQSFPVRKSENPDYKNSKDGGAINNMTGRFEDGLMITRELKAQSTKDDWVKGMGFTCKYWNNPKLQKALRTRYKEMLENGDVEKIEELEQDEASNQPTLFEATKPKKIKKAKEVAGSGRDYKKITKSLMLHLTDEEECMKIERKIKEILLGEGSTKPELLCHLMEGIKSPEGSQKLFEEVSDVLKA